MNYHNSQQLLMIVFNKGKDTFNQMQTEIASEILHTDVNLLIFNIHTATDFLSLKLTQFLPKLIQCPFPLYSM